MNKEKPSVFLMLQLVFQMDQCSAGVVFNSTNSQGSVINMAIHCGVGSGKIDNSM